MAVAAIVAELINDPASVVSALLHDVVEDTTVNLSDIKNSFGKEASDIVNALTKLNRINYHSKEDAQAENFRKMIVAMANDLRAIIIKICDRLHNMRTLHHLDEKRQVRIAKETVDIYAPLAHRLGLGVVKAELEDLSLKYLKPDAYYTIAKELQEKRIERESHIKEVITEIKILLDKHKIKYRIEGRAKHIYSICKKMEKNSIDIKDINLIYDLFAVRVITEDIKSCYMVLGIIHPRFKLVPGRFKDYIALPKANMYQSLHTTVFAPSGRVVEIQIRTEQMDNVAKNGIAVHWRYKEGGKFNLLDKRFVWMKHLLQWQKDLKNSKEFLGSMKIDLMADEIYVFTPNGDLKVLPRGSNVIDFAYSIHTAVGDECTGAIVNGKMVPLKTQLKTGNIVSIITSKNHHPSKDWLAIVKTSKAKNKIRQWIRNKERESAIAIGKEMLVSRLKEIGISLHEYSKSPETIELLKRLSRKNIEDLYVDIGNGKLSVVTAVKHFYKEKKAAKKAGSNKPTVPGSPIVIDGLYLDNLMVNLARCCNPVPGDKIVGFVTRGRGVTIHRMECSNLDNLMLEKDRLVNVKWKTISETFNVSLCVTTADKVGMLAKLTSVIGSRGINIVNVALSTDDIQKVTTVKFVLGIKSNKQINALVQILRSLEDIISVERIIN